MKDIIYTHLQLRELFHIEFLRILDRKLKARNYAVKGGVNLHLFFKSIRYSEDMDLDIAGIGVAELKETVMEILQVKAFREGFYAFGIKDIIQPDMRVAKQTQTTQCFRVHLITTAGEDLFTKVEFSRRGIMGNVVTESVPAILLRHYRLSPLIIAHYDGYTATMQQINALASKAAIQARDVFDLYILSSQVNPDVFQEGATVDASAANRAYKRLLEVSFEMFRDSMVSYLSEEDQITYGNASYWEEIKLKAAGFIEESTKAK